MINLKSKLTALFAAVAFTLAACGGGSGPGAVYTDLMKLVEKGEVDKAAEHIHIEPEVALIINEQKLKSILAKGTEEFAERGGIKKIKILEENIDGVTASIRAETHMGDGSKETDEVSFIKIDGEWKMKLDMNM